MKRLTGEKQLKTSVMFDENGRFLRSAKQCADSLSAHFKGNWNTSDQDEDHVFSDAFLEHSWFCDPADIEELIQKIDSSAAIGFDVISPKFLKACSTEIAPAVAALLNKCPLDGEFPDSWKHSRVVAIRKSQGAESVVDMRPISILPVLSKIGEHWLKSICKPFLMDKSHSHQFAYLPGRSTEDAIALVQYYVTSGFRACSKATRVAAVSLDVSKAFDTVPKRNLLQVLRVRNGLPDGLARLLYSYMHNRRQTVQFSNKCSSAEEVVSGVPQGSILGPHLFSAYVDSVLDFPLSQNSRIISFSEDLILIKPIFSDRDCEDLQDDIDSLVTSYGSKLLKINPVKSKFILFTLENNQDSIQLSTALKIMDTIIERVPVLKYLGVFLDPKLSFGTHTERQAVKAKRAISALYRSLGKWTNKEIFKEVYTKKILPLYLYALPLVAPSSAYHCGLLEKVNRFAGRLIENDYCTSYNELLRKLEWKSVTRHIVERQLILMWKYSRNQRVLPEGTLISWDIPSRLRRGFGRHDRMLTINDKIFCGNGSGRIDRKTQGRCAFYTCVQLWNTLSPEIVEMNLNNFKTAVKDVGIFHFLANKFPELIRNVTIT
ncbi:MAG: reverse transcriptase family protein [Gammaproteobacteria bacterium]|nr:reverse transcriptase family protein [Gammaproteobacteria bacterium]